MFAFRKQGLAQTMKHSPSMVVLSDSDELQARIQRAERENRVVFHRFNVSLLIPRYPALGILGFSVDTRNRVEWDTNDRWPRPEWGGVGCADSCLSGAPNFFSAERLIGLTTQRMHSLSTHRSNLRNPLPSSLEMARRDGPNRECALHRQLCHL